MHEANRNTGENINQLRRLNAFENRRLDRPDSEMGNNLFPSGRNTFQFKKSFPVVIPIPPEDAKALGLRVPNAEKPSVNSHPGSSKDAASFPGSKSPSKSPKSGKASSEKMKRATVHSKMKKEAQDSRHDKKRTYRNIATESPQSFHRKLEHGLKSLSDGAQKRRKIGSQSENNSEGSGKSATPEENRSDKLKKDSSNKSMRQLFSMAGSWSSDSVASHSDSCACCHNRESCPLHGSSFFNDTRF